MADFTALPVQNGVGPYHFNRYRIVFARPKNATKEALARDFVTAFPHYFNSQYATVQFHPDRQFDDKPTLEFHGVKNIAKTDVAKPHNDWVARIWMDPNIGFTAQTLKREFFEAGEDAKAAAGGAAGGALIGAPFTPASPLAPVIGGVVGAGTAVHYNRMHFLAGRRSWRLDTGAAFGVPGDVLVLETSAVERFSAKVYQGADWVLHMEEMIPPIWSANLANFSRLKNLTPVAQTLLPNWKVSKTERTVNYYISSVDTLGELQSLPEFRKAWPLFKTLLPPEIANT